MAKVIPFEGKSNRMSHVIVRRNISPQEATKRITDMGFDQLAAQCAGMDLPDRIAAMHNDFESALAGDIARILQRRQIGEMSDNEYALLKTIFPDLP